MLNTLALLSLTQAQFAFTGNNLSAMATAVSEFWKEPVVMLFDPTVPIAPFTVGAETREAFRARFEGKTGYRIAELAPFGFAQKFWPEGMFSGSLRSNYESITSSLDFLEFKTENGKIDIASYPTRTVRLKDLTKLKLSKQIKSHWYYLPASLAISAKGVDEPTLVKLIAQTVGGKFEDTAESYEIKFEPRMMRFRAMEHFQRSIKRTNSKSRISDAQFAIEAYRSAPDTVISKAFQSADSSASYTPTTNSSVIAAFNNRFNANVSDPANSGSAGAMMAVEGAEGIKEGGAVTVSMKGSSLSDRLNRAKTQFDYSKPLTIVLYGDGRVTAKVPRKGANVEPFEF